MFRVLLISLLMAALSVHADAKVYHAAISKDGASLAVVQKLDGKKIVSIFSADDASAKPMGVGLGDFEPQQLYWQASGIPLVQVNNIMISVQTVDGLKRMNFARWVSIDPSSGEMKMLFDNEAGFDYGYFVGDAGDLLATGNGKKNEAVFSRMRVRQQRATATRLSSGSDQQVYSLINVNVSNTKERRGVWGNENTQQWVVDETGAAVARADLEMNDTVWNLYKYAERNASLRATLNLTDGNLEEIAVVGRLPETDELLVRVKGAENGWRYRQINLTSGAIAPANFDLAGPPTDEIYDPNRAIIHAIVDQSGHAHHFDPVHQKIQSGLQKSLPGSSILIESAAGDVDRYVIKATYADKPAERYFYDRSAKRLELIAKD